MATDGQREGVRPLHILAILMTCLAAPALAQDGAALYKEHCASCHDRGADRAPGRDVLRAISPQRILEVLEFGSMVSMTHGRTTAERRALAEFASGKSLGERFTIAPAPKAMCRSNPTFSMESSQPVWNGFRTGSHEREVSDVADRAGRGRRAASKDEMGLWPSR